MFSSSRTSTLAQRALGALRLTRSFLLLEDDREIDWEVGADGRPEANHPHRAPLRVRLPERRPGARAQRNHVCLTPLAPRQDHSSAHRAKRSGNPGRAAAAYEQQASPHPNDSHR